MVNLFAQCNNLFGSLFVSGNDSCPFSLCGCHLSIDSSLGSNKVCIVCTENGLGGIGVEGCYLVSEACEARVQSVPVVGVLGSLVAILQCLNVCSNSFILVDGIHSGPVLGTDLLLSGLDGLTDVVDALLQEVELCLVVIAFCIVDIKILYQVTNLVKILLIACHSSNQLIVLCNCSNGVGLVGRNLTLDSRNLGCQAGVVSLSRACAIHLIGGSSIGSELGNLSLYIFYVLSIVVLSLVVAIL